MFCGERERVVFEGATSEREEKIPGWSDWEREKKRQSRIMKDVEKTQPSTCEGCQVNSDFKEDVIQLKLKK